MITKNTSRPSQLSTVSSRKTSKYSGRHLIINSRSLDIKIPSFDMSKTITNSTKFKTHYLTTFIASIKDISLTMNMVPLPRSLASVIQDKSIRAQEKN
jgi:hypothetical protein